MFAVVKVKVVLERVYYYPDDERVIIRLTDVTTLLQALPERDEAGTF